MASAASATQTATPSIASTTTDSTTGSTTGSTSSTSSSTTTILLPDSTQTSLLGPLTTTFTAPTQCSQAYWLSDSSEVYYPTIGQTCTTVDGGIAYNPDSSCLPPVTSTILASLVGPSEVISIYSTYDYQGYYSPGIACPAGYTTACAAQAGADGIQSTLSNFQSFGFVYTATADETVVGCCPRGYQCTSIPSSQWCQRVIASTTQPLVTCVNVTGSAPASATTQFTLPTMVTLSFSDTLLSTEVTTTLNYTTLTMLATMVQMKFQATDLASTSSLSSSSSLSSTSLPTPLPTPLPTILPTILPTTTSSGSSSNHKTTTIAVSVVIPCLAALVAASLGWLWYRRRAKIQSSTSYQAAQSTEPPNSYYGTGSEPTEMLGDSARIEMEGSPVMHEMAGRDPKPVMHEMYAGNEIPQHHNHEGHDDSH